MDQKYFRRIKKFSRASSVTKNFHRAEKNFHRAEKKFFIAQKKIFITHTTQKNYKNYKNLGGPNCAQKIALYSGGPKSTPKIYR